MKLRKHSTDFFADLHHVLASSLKYNLTYYQYGTYCSIFHLNCRSDVFNFPYIIIKYAESKEKLSHKCKHTTVPLME